MNDVNWRSFDDDQNWELIMDNPYHAVIVETTKAIRGCKAENIESTMHGPWLWTHREVCLRFAFLTGLSEQARTEPGLTVDKKLVE